MYSTQSTIQHSCSVFLYFILIARFLIIFKIPRKKPDPKSVQHCSAWSPLSYYEDFYPDGSGLFQDDSVPCQRIRGTTEWCREHETMWMICYAILSHQILIQLKETWPNLSPSPQIITASIKALYAASKSFKAKTCYFCNARRTILERKPGLQFLAVVSSLYVEPISLSPIFSLPFIWQIEWYKFSHLSLLL